MPCSTLSRIERMTREQNRMEVSYQKVKLTHPKPSHKHPTGNVSKMHGSKLKTIGRRKWQRQTVCRNRLDHHRNMADPLARSSASTLEATKLTPGMLHPTQRNTVETRSSTSANSVS